MLATDRTRWDWEYFEEYFRLGVLWVEDDVLRWVAAYFTCFLTQLNNSLQELN